MASTVNDQDHTFTISEQKRVVRKRVKNKQCALQKKSSGIKINAGLKTRRFE